MARGNDSAAALVDLRGEFGGIGGNAQELIDAAHDAYGPELRQANILPRDPDASRALKHEHDGLKKASAKVGSDAGEPIDVAVHGDWVVVVYELPSGRTYKAAFPAEEFGAKVEGSRRQAVAQDATNESEEARETRRARLQEAAERTKALHEAEAAVHEARQNVESPRRRSAEEKSSAKSEDK